MNHTKNSCHHIIKGWAIGLIPEKTKGEISMIHTKNLRHHIIKGWAIGLFVLIAMSSSAWAAEELQTAYGRIVKSDVARDPDLDDSSAEIVPLDQRYLARPILDVPLRDPSICRGPDGIYYLTGTGAAEGPDGQPDFLNDNTIRMWKSADRENWEEIGVVFDPLKVDIEDGSRVTDWLRRPRGIAGKPDSLRHYMSLQAPELHYIKGTYWIAFSGNNQGTGLLKSTTGKAEGPYEVWGTQLGRAGRMITADGADPSMFEDEDGAVYWLWSPSWIARMNDDLTGLAEEPRLLTCKPQYPNAGANLVGSRGPFLWKANGIYHLAVADTISRLGIHVEDTMVATSSSLEDTFTRRFMMIPHGGQITVFQDGEGAYQAAICGSDRYAAVRDRAGIVPLEWMTHYRHTRYPQGGLLRPNPSKVYTERGPWHKLLPLFHAPGFNIRDHHLMQAPDGYFYASGTVYGKPYMGKMVVYRSKDLREWEEITVRSVETEPNLNDEDRQAWKTKVSGNPNSLARAGWSLYYMDTNINWVPKLKTFVIGRNPWFQGGKKAQDWLVSTSGKWDGPYDPFPGSGLQKFFQDDDGTFYTAYGTHILRRLNEDFSIDGGPWDPVEPARGVLPFEDNGCGMVKMHGKYVFFSIAIATTRMASLHPDMASYTYNYMTADSPKGPWSKWMPGLPHCAWGVPFRGLDGHWYASTFDLPGQPLLLYMVRLKTELRDGQVYIDIDDDWTPADYVPIDGWKGEGEFSPYTDTAKGPTAQP